jgi:hypothetical protein
VPDPGDLDTDGYVMAYERLDDCDIVACADIVEESARAFAACHVYTAYHELLERANLDVVSVCTPPSAVTWRAGGRFRPAETASGVGGPVGRPLRADHVPRAGGCRLPR